MTSSDDRSNVLDIAVIGMAGRFPQASSIPELWEHLKNGRELLHTFSDEELLAAGLREETIGSPQYVRRRGVLADIDLFDADFFGYSPTEARAMDPQHRVFLETAWQALEDAGYDSERCGSTIGVYASSSLSDYRFQASVGDPDLMAALPPTQVLMGADKDFLATRVCYKLNLTGPGISVQTACSSSLVAIHLACQGLLSGEVDIALAGGVSIAAPRQAGYQYSPGGILSPDGRCRAFDATANGCVPGSGAAVVVLKRASDSLEDHDTIHAFVKSSAVNNDGSDKIGYTAPSISGQANAIRAAHLVAQIKSSSVTYIEAHGTGTEMGDPIELMALREAFQGPRDEQCLIGSIKTNIGHLDAAAGVTGLVKAVLALKHREIPPSLHFQNPNQKFDMDASPFRIVSKLTKWQTDRFPRRAGVSSFGIGGTNAHVVLEEPPQVASSLSSRVPQVVVLSAKSAKALERAAERLAQHLTEEPSLDLSSVAHTLQVGRRQFDHRRAIICSDSHRLVEYLAAERRTSGYFGQVTELPPAVSFLFPGQGSQYPGMARGLAEILPTFKDVFDRCCELAARNTDVDFRRLLCEPGDEDAVELLRQTEIAQPAVFIVEYSMAQALIELGVEPQAMIGHSIGEYVAAALADTMKLADALRLIAIRGRLMASLPKGAMLAVPLGIEELRCQLGAGLAISAENGIRSNVVGGSIEDIEEFSQMLQVAGVRTQRLHTSHAFHSKMMQPIAEEFQGAVRSTKLRAPKRKFISNVSGTWITPEEACSPAYWARHLRETVRFATGLDCLLAEPNAVYLEVGPGRSLGSLARQHPAFRDSHRILAMLPHPKEAADPQIMFLSSIAQLWTNGANVRWAALHDDSKVGRVSLPTYPFERKRYWFASTDARGNGIRASVRRRPDEWFSVPAWRMSPTPTPGALKDGPWLICGDDELVNREILAILEQQKIRANQVRSGKGYGELSANKFVVDTQSEDDFSRLLMKLADEGQMPVAVLHLWGYGEDGATSDSSELFFSLLHLGQALISIKSGSPIPLIAATSGSYDVTGLDRIVAQRAVLSGPCRVLAHESRYILSRLVDFPYGGEGASQVQLKQMVSEAQAGDYQPIVAWRGDRRWIQAFENVRIPPFRQERSPFAGKGAYLITGGFGGIGKALARRLAKFNGSRIALLSRTPTPPRSDWAEIAAFSEEDARARRIAYIQSLEAEGAEILLLQADVADRESLRKAVGLMRDRFGAIDGVIHCAGVAGSGMVHVKEREAASKVLRPKVAGAINLLDLVKKDRPLFVAFCSSLASLLGGIGQVDYCSANAFLDSFAREQAQATGNRIVSINWDTWRDGGMAVDSVIPQDLEYLRARSLDRGISDEEGVDAFLRIIAGPPLTQVAISTTDLSSRIQPAANQVPGRVEADEGDSKPSLAERYSRPDLASAYIAPGDDLQKRVCTVWESVLGIEGIGVNDSFFELGGHSLLAIQAMEKTNALFGTNIPVAHLYEVQTPSGVSETLRGGALAARGSLPEESDTRDEARRQRRRRQKKRAEKLRR